MNVDNLDTDSRRKLIQLACVAAWSDTSVSPEERVVVLDLCETLALGDDCATDVKAWLDGPPPYVDPQEIPREHRETFVQALETVVGADGRIEPEESETLRLIRELLR